MDITKMFLSMINKPKDPYIQSIIDSSPKYIGYCDFVRDLPKVANEGDMVYVIQSDISYVRKGEEWITVEEKNERET